jgi:DNA-binding beta-propeller fold protein YncE
MMRCAACLTLILGLGSALPALRADDATTKDAPAPRALPGVKSGGGVLLPNGWSLKPAGRQLPLGDFPINLTLHPSGEWLAVLHGGHGDHEVALIDLKKQKTVSRVLVDQAFYGLAFSPDGKQLFASGGEFEVVHAFDFADGLLSHHRRIRICDPDEKWIVAGIAIDAKGTRLATAGPWGHAVAVVPLDRPDEVTKIPVGKESFPYASLFDRDGRRLFVSLWGAAAVAVIDLEASKLVATWPTENHPTEMVLSPDGKTLFVACANSTQVSVLDTAGGRGLETINCALYPAVPKGNTPNSVCLTPDGKMLFVANADNNNVAVFNVAEPGRAKPLGFIPTGWYPTAVRYNPADKRLYVANGKGASSFANPQGPQPNVPERLPQRQYIADLFHGTLSILDLPDPERMADYSKTAYACSPLRADQGVIAPRPNGNPVPAAPGQASPIKHVIYVIKENRTYDQVFGDIKEGNGDPNLCLFPEKVTPNHHRLARQFVLLDNFYCDGEVSADGHEWSMGAYATDFVEKIWPLVYRPNNKKKFGYHAEGNYAIATPAGGYIWDRCAEAGVTYRSYGEWIHPSKDPGQPGKAMAKALEGHFDPWFRGFDLDYPDQKRADRFLEELKGFEAKGEMPRLIILRLPNDHTSGTRFSKPTPTAYVADNDLALGRVVEGVSRSKFWKDTAIFVVEDDAQNGPDHVDAHRTVALVVSPWTRIGRVDSSMYSTASMLRTMELILGLKPMSQFDAAARPMYASFQAKADERPYEHLVPDADLKETNARTAWGGRQSEKFDLTKEDQADDQVFNEVIWRAVKGEKSAMPPPVRAAFVFPHLKKDKDKDDD